MGPQWRGCLGLARQGPACTGWPAARRVPPARDPEGRPDGKIPRERASDRAPPTPATRPASDKASLTPGMSLGSALGALLPGFPCREGPRAGPPGSAAKKTELSKAQGPSTPTRGCHRGQGWGEGLHLWSTPSSEGQVWEASWGLSALKCGKVCFWMRLLVHLK